jgi:poly-gamma-glutamate synthesis protein (capsule biosynthesis protein)
VRGKVNELGPRLVHLTALVLLIPGVLAGCHQQDDQPTTSHDSVAATVTPSLDSTTCLVVQGDLWREEAPFFETLRQEHPGCTIGVVDHSSQVLEMLRAGEAEIAVISGNVSEPGSELVRKEPFVLVGHMANPLDLAPRAWLRDVFGGSGEYRPVMVDEGLAVKELLGLDHIARDAIRASSWEEAKELVATDVGSVALLPWRLVDFRLRALAIDKPALMPDSLRDYAYQRQWWLVGNLDAHSELADVVREGLWIDVEPVVDLVAVGDVMLGRGVGSLIAANSPSYPFLSSRDLIAEADIAFGNLENPITSRGEPGGGIIFRARPEAVEGLSYAGFDILSLANNHSDDYGATGLLDTMSHLNREGIAQVGLAGAADDGQVAVTLEVGGLSVAFLAYNHIGPRWIDDVDGRSGPAWLEPESAYKDVRRAADDSDFVVVSLHWGAEYLPLPDEQQEEVAHQLVEAGAGLVLGHHPHVIGGVSYDEKGFVAYSLGNFVFDQPFSVETTQGLLLRSLIDRSGLKQVQLIPVRMEAAQPKILPAPEARSVLCEILDHSGMLDVHSGEERAASQGDLRQGELSQVWAVPLERRVRALSPCYPSRNHGPAITVATGSAGGPSSVYLLDSDGSTVWEHALERPVNDLECGDLDGDGKNEVVVAAGLMDSPGEVLVLDAVGWIRWRFAVEAGVLDIDLGNAGGDALPEVAAGEWGAFGDTIYLLGGDGRVLWKHQTDGSVHSVGMADLAGDDAGEVVAGADDVYALGGSGELLWRHPTASYVHGLVSRGLARGGTERIVAITRFPNPAVSVLGDDGALIWRLPLPASPSTAVLSDADDDRQEGLLVGLMDGTVLSIDIDGSLGWRSSVVGSVSDVALGDVDGDGISDLVVGTGDCLSRGGIYALDLRSGAVLGFREEADSVKALVVADMDGVGGDEIVAALDSGRVLVLGWTAE